MHPFDALALPEGRGPGVSVKEMAFETTAPLTDEGHAAKALTDQAQVGLMKPNLVSALIQRGALR